jgi:hypothetical protein
LLAEFVVSFHLHEHMAEFVREMNALPLARYTLADVTGSSPLAVSSNGSRSTCMATNASVIPDLTLSGGQLRQFQESQSRDTPHSQIHHLAVSKLVTSHESSHET